MEKLLLCYPFSDSHVRLIQGFSAYDAALGDTAGTVHKGIDYILGDPEAPHPFTVHAMHDGMAFQGQSDSWGTFVILHTTREDRRFSTVYAHLDTIAVEIAPQFIEHEGKRITNRSGTSIHAGQLLGLAGISGETHGFPQLHIELHEKSDGRGKLTKLDPYGINDRASSGRYPQPGSSLAGLDHAWTADAPPFAG